MSDWNRSGRQDEQRRYGEDRDQWGFGGRDRRSGGRGGERRTFGQDEGRYGGRREAEEWDDPQRAYGTQGAGSRGYGRQEYGGDWRSQERGSRGQGYGAETYGGGQYGGQRSGERDYGDSDYGERSYRERNYGVGGYGGRDEAGRNFGEDRNFGRFGQGYGDYRNQPRYGERGGGLPRNEPLQRVTDGESDQGMRANLGGMGEHRGRGPKNYTRSDDRIREDINDRLTDDSWVDASGIDVVVAKCEVTLNGTVDSREEKRRAEDLAEQVSGVKHVQNNLRIERSGMQAGGQTGSSAATGQSGASTTGQTGATQQTTPARGTTHS